MKNKNYPRIRWKESEIKFLEENYNNLSQEEISKKLNKTKDSISKKASRLKLRKEFWTKEQESLLINNYREHTTKELSEMIGKTIDAISQRLSSKYNLKKTSGDLSIISKRIHKNYCRGKNHHFWKGGYVPPMEGKSLKYASKKWAKIRDKALIHFSYSCQKCGLTKDESRIEIHHIIPVNSNGSDELKNLTCLCSKCHWGVHNGNIKI